jgi:hypothetical protein
MTVNNIPSPVRPTDAESVLGLLASDSKKHERNVNDPNEWIYVGNEGHATNPQLPDQPWAPPFQNGFFNVGAPRVLLRYRFLRPYDPYTTQNAVQLQGSVAGGSTGQVIFQLTQPLWSPDGTVHTPPYTMDSDVFLTCCDDSGLLVVVTIQSTGNVYLGFV